MEFFLCFFFSCWRILQQTIQSDHHAIIYILEQEKRDCPFPKPTCLLLEAPTVPALGYKSVLRCGVERFRVVLPGNNVPCVANNTNTEVHQLSTRHILQNHPVWQFCIKVNHYFHLAVCTIEWHSVELFSCTLPEPGVAPCANKPCQFYLKIYFDHICLHSTCSIYVCIFISCRYMDI